MEGSEAWYAMGVGGAPKESSAGGAGGWSPK